MNSATGISLLWFVAIVALIPLLLWLLKRSPLGGHAIAGSGGAAMRTVSALPISPSQRLVTVEVGTGEDRRWLVLGVTAQSITTLHTMAPQAVAVAVAVAVPADGAPPAAAPSFARLLGSLRKGDRGAP